VASQALYVANSAYVSATGNTFVDQCPGSDGTDAKSNIVVFENPLECSFRSNTLISNDTTTYTSSQNNTAVLMIGGAAWSAVSGINGTTAALPSLRVGANVVRGTRYGLFADTATNYRQTSGGVLTVEEDGVVSVPSGSQALEHGCTQARKDANGAMTFTLKAAANCLGTEVTVRNAAVSDDITMAAASGSITATTLTPGQYATFRARGTTWERVA
jgi:hypothetical protein